MTFARIDELCADFERVRETDPGEIAEILSLARTGLQSKGPPWMPRTPAPLLEQLIAKLPDFDLGWTPEQKLSWFEGMAKLIQAAS